METSSPKLVAVIVAALLHWFLGAAWFTLLKKPWLEGIGKTSEQLMASGIPPWLPHVVTLIANFALAYLIGWLILATGAQTVARGLMIAALLWLCVVASTFATEYVFEARSIQSFLINTGYPFAGMLIMGALLGGWKR
jgi:hypothetical protein